MFLDIEIYKLFIKRQAQFVVKVMKESGKLKTYSKRLEEKFDLLLLHSIMFIINYKFIHIL